MKRFILAVLILTSVALYPEETSRMWGVFFTDPNNTSSDINHPENAIISLIDQSSKSIDGAFYDIRSSRITEALIMAKSRGITVRLVTDDSHLEREQVNQLIERGIPIESDGRHGLMHNKFMIIDRTIVWTGSYNITDSGAWENNNNAIALYSPQLADIFTREFEEMFQDSIYGNKENPGPFNYFLNSSEADDLPFPVSAYFSPEDSVKDVILSHINNAETSIYFMAFSFTDSNISDAIIEASKRGILTGGIFEKNGSNTPYSEYVKLKIEGVPVILDNNEGCMHHKVIIIDDRYLITGSFNFSRNADTTNDENILIIDNGDIASLYLEEFERLFRD